MELLSLLLPILIDVVNRRVTNDDARLWISVAICAVLGVFLNFLDTNLIFDTPMAGFESISHSILVVFGLAQLSFKAFWEKTEVHRALKPESDSILPPE